MLNILKTILDKLNLLDFEGRLSLSNITVAIFVLIAAIRMLLGGSIIYINTFEWKIQTIDISATLPMLFALINYMDKRKNINQATSNDEKEK